MSSSAEFLSAGESVYSAENLRDVRVRIGCCHCVSCRDQNLDIAGPAISEWPRSTALDAIEPLIGYESGYASHGVVWAIDLPGPILFDKRNSRCYDLLLQI